MEEILNPTKEIFDPTKEIFDSAKVAKLAREFAVKFHHEPTSNKWIRECLDLIAKGRADTVFYAIRILNHLVKARNTKSVLSSGYMDQVNDEYVKQSNERYDLLSNPNYVKLIGDAKAEEIKNLNFFDIEGIDVLKLASKFEVALTSFVERDNSIASLYEEQRTLYDKKRRILLNFPKDRIKTFASNLEKKLPKRVQSDWRNVCDKLISEGRQDRVYDTVKLLNSVLPKAAEKTIDRVVIKERLLAEYENQSKTRMRNVKSLVYAERIGVERAEYMEKHDFDIEGLEVLSLALTFAPEQIDCYESIRSLFDEQLAKQKALKEEFGDELLARKVFFTERKSGIGLAYDEYLNLMNKLQKIKDRNQRFVPEDRKDVYEKWYKAIEASVESARQSPIYNYNQDVTVNVKNLVDDFVNASYLLELDRDLILKRSGTINANQAEMLYSFGSPEVRELFKQVRDTNGKLVYGLKSENPGIIQRGVEKVSNIITDAVDSGIDRLGDLHEEFLNKKAELNAQRNNSIEKAIQSNPNFDSKDEGKGLT